MYYYIYILRSINHPDQIYVGCTSNLSKRLSDHNCGTTVHTDKYKPWKVVIYIAFEAKIKAYLFEKFFKSAPGGAFRNKKLL